MAHRNPWELAVSVFRLFCFKNGKGRILGIYSKGPPDAAAVAASGAILKQKKKFVLPVLTTPDDSLDGTPELVGTRDLLPVARFEAP